MFNQDMFNQDMFNQDMFNQDICYFIFYNLISLIHVILTFVF